MNNFIIHYGVKGQKWGVRKSRASQVNTHPRTRRTAQRVSKNKAQRKKKTSKPPTWEEVQAEQRAKQRQREATIAMLTGRTNEYVSAQMSRPINQLATQQALYAPRVNYWLA